MSTDKTLTPRLVKKLWLALIVLIVVIGASYIFITGYFERFVMGKHKDKYRKTGQSIYNNICNRTVDGNGIRIDNLGWMCGPGWPIIPLKVELVGSEQNPRTGYCYLIKKSVWGTLTRLMGSNHRPPYPE